ncbi:hypothetical protein [Caulobacter sp. NIBR1757]|uniref:hypothetical protein n=1 Tax=Caulobacter sp. NIBR1757 TaxID=3016000 RepID=UPI0022F07D4C|nr:hypothetical protein [Caulobacter sp. NIBR1757]WGM39828.1 hypothetical protein AMEJIAPC_02768 [Caulobacter sp. NIBR1757]
MKAALVGGLIALCISVPAFAGPAEEQALAHWGECAMVGAIWEMRIDEAGAARDIEATLKRFKELEPRMEIHANALAAAIGDERAQAIQSSLLESFDSRLNDRVAAEDKAGFMIATWGPTMERCLREAATLPTAALPTT